MIHQWLNNKKPSSEITQLKRKFVRSLKSWEVSSGYAATGGRDWAMLIDTRNSVFQAFILLGILEMNETIVY